MQHRAFAGFWLISAAALVHCWAGPAQAQQPAAAARRKLGIVTFLTGPAAAPFGIPDRNAAELLIEALNAGKVPAPYNQVGLRRRQDRGQIRRRGGFGRQRRHRIPQPRAARSASTSSSATSRRAAASRSTPVAEELKALTVLDDLRHAAHLRGKAAQLRVPRQPARDHGQRRGRQIRAGPRSRTSRSIPASTRTTPGARIPGAISAWRMKDARAQGDRRQGAVSETVRRRIRRRDLDAADVERRRSSIRASTTAISKRSSTRRARADCSQRIPIVLTTGEAAIWRLGDKLPDGTIIGARGPHGPSPTTAN